MDWPSAFALVGGAWAYAWLFGGKARSASSEERAVCEPPLFKSTHYVQEPEEGEQGELNILKDKALQVLWCDERGLSMAKALGELRVLLKPEEA